MRHGFANKKLNRNSEHRKALLKNMLNSLIKYEQIITTLPKAKELKPKIDKVITIGKDAKLSKKKDLFSKLQDQKSVKKVLDILSKRYANRKGGYSRVLKAGFRTGDDAPMAVIELVDRDVNAKKIDKPKKVEKANKDKKEISSSSSKDWYFWSEGSVNFGKIGDTSTSSAKDIDSNNVTFGMDTKTNNDVIYGYAFGFNKDDVDIGNVGTSVDVDAYNLSLYSEFPTAEDGFLETVIGLNTLDIDNIRKSGSDTLKGSRDGRQIFGSFNYLSTFNGKELTVIPNLKINFSRTTLSEYTESGTSPLKYDKQTVETANIYTGLNFHNIFKLLKVKLGKQKKRSQELLADGTGYVTKCQICSEGVGVPLVETPACAACEFPLTNALGSQRH